MPKARDISHLPMLEQAEIIKKRAERNSYMKAWRVKLPPEKHQEILKAKNIRCHAWRAERTPQRAEEIREQNRKYQRAKRASRTLEEAEADRIAMRDRARAVPSAVKKIRLNRKNTQRQARCRADRSALLSDRLRTRISKVVRRSIASDTKPGSAVKDLGCSIDQLVTHLRIQFEQGMSWDNYGTNGWHIDHVVPLSSFDLSDPEQFKKAVHFTNLQPLWAADNIAKGCKLPEYPLAA